MRRSLTVLALFFAITFWTAFVVMITFGILHSFFRVVPAFSYIESFVLLIAFRLIFFRTTVRDVAE